MTSDNYKKIENSVKEIMEKSRDPQHGLDHLNRVRANALRIVKILNLEPNIDTNLLSAICLLHDIPMNTTYKFPFGMLGKHLMEKSIVLKKLPGILEGLPLTGNERKIALTAIANHPLSIPYGHLNRGKDYYSKVLQDADSLDYVSGERTVSLERAKNKYFFYFLASLIAKPYLSWVKKNIRKFLNFPELADRKNLT
jgi:hypothetical protein